MFKMMCFDDVFFNGMTKLIIVYWICALVFIVVYQFAKWLFPTGEKNEQKK